MVIGDHGDIMAVIVMGIIMDTGMVITGVTLLVPGLAIGQVADLPVHDQPPIMYTVTDLMVCNLQASGIMRPKQTGVEIQTGQEPWTGRGVQTGRAVPRTVPRQGLQTSQTMFTATATAMSSVAITAETGNRDRETVGRIDQAAISK